MDRDDLLSRYRSDRAISVEIQTGALKYASRSAILKQAKRLGLSDGKSLVLNSENELPLVFDLLLYTVPRGGRSRAIDRYAHAHRPEPGSDQERVLSALQSSRFSLFQIKERHAAAGLLIEDLLRQEEVWLIDESLEVSAQAGMVLGMRIATPDVFAITCGVLVPLDEETLRELAYVMNEAEAEPADLADDPRFAESIYQLAVQLSLTDHVGYR